MAPTYIPIMIETAQHDNPGRKSAPEISKRSGALSVIRTTWIWTTSLATAGAAAFRLAKPAYPDPFACAKPPGSEADGTILICSFAPIIRYDQLVFGALYMWVLTSLIITLIAMRWRAAGMVLMMALALIVADITTQAVHDYLR